MRSTLYGLVRGLDRLWDGAAGVGRGRENRRRVLPLSGVGCTLRAPISGLHLSARTEDNGRVSGQLLVESPDGGDAEAVRYFTNKDPDGVSAVVHMAKLSPLVLEVDVRMSTFDGRSRLSVRAVRCVEPASHDSF
jgi:hypothetical protein